MTCLIKGLNFKHVYGDFTIEVHEVRESMNELTVVVTSSNAHEYKEVWNLKHTEVGFTRGEYVTLEPPKRRTIQHDT